MAQIGYLAANDTKGYLSKTKGISSAEKVAAIEKLTGTSYDAAKSGLNNQAKGGLQGAYSLMSTVADAKAKWGMAPEKNAFMDKVKTSLTDDAYANAVRQGLYEKRDVTDAEKKSLGYLDHHGKWVAQTNRLTGEKDFAVERVHKITSGNAGLKGNWNRNQAAWQAGIGAVLGFLSGGPVGAVTGAVGGYAAGKPGQDAFRAGRKAQYLGGGGGLTPEKLRYLRDIARSRAAGAGTFNYTQQEYV